MVFEGEITHVVTHVSFAQAGELFDFSDRRGLPVLVDETSESAPSGTAVHKATGDVYTVISLMPVRGKPVQFCEAERVIYVIERALDMSDLPDLGPIPTAF